MSIIPAGSMFYISSGSQDDYTVHKMFRAIIDLDYSGLQDDYFMQNPLSRRPLNPYRPSGPLGLYQYIPFPYEEYINWLVLSGKIDPIKGYEMSLPETDQKTYVTTEEWKLPPDIQQWIDANGLPPPSQWDDDIRTLFRLRFA